MGCTVSHSDASTTFHPSGASGLDLRRAPTETVRSEDCSFKVVEYSAMDRAPKLGAHIHEAHWKVLAGFESAELDIRVQVDTSIRGRAGVRVTCGEDVLYTGPQGGAASDDVLEDLVFQWPFRRKATNLGKAGVYEVSLFGSQGVRQWFAAKVVSQRDDGSLEVVANVPNSTGEVQEIRLPAVRAEDLRETENKSPLNLELNSLVLEVPRANPLAAALHVDGVGPVSQQLAWKSLTRDGLSPAVALKVSQDRKRVTANVGHNELKRFLSGEVRAGGGPAHAQRHQRVWSIEVGPSAQHTIKLERKSLNSKNLTLSIDGSPFVEASAQDLGCDSDAWECKFDLCGEKTLDFEVFETSRQGLPLDSKAHVKTVMKYRHACVVRLNAPGDIHSAALVVDDVPYHRIPPMRRMHAEGKLDMQHEALQILYNITAPHHVNQDLPSVLQEGLESVTRVLQDAPTKLQAGYEGVAAALSDLDAPSRLQVGYAGVAAAFAEAPIRLQAGYGTASANLKTVHEKDSHERLPNVLV